MGASCFLAMVKPSNKIQPFILGEALYFLTSHTLCVYNFDFFSTHFPFQVFGIVIKGGYKLNKWFIALNVPPNFHPNGFDWVVLGVDMVKAFNFMSRKVMFLKLRKVKDETTQFIPFIHTFYVYESPLYFTQRS